ncbi:MAG TPA: ABC transporter substrate-binding protein, partial [Aquihabitans sp.]|nr:ABC transporter substrate-binding protein [Aquihabitans sp.]
ENTGSVNLLAAVEPEEGEAVQAIFDEMINNDADYEVEIEASGNFEEQFQIRAEGGTLDVAAVPQPGAIADLAEAGNIVALEDLGFDIEELNGLFGEEFVALGEHEGKHYGLPTNINLKSMVWYPKDDFEEAGYEEPETWDDLIALSDQIVEDGGTPWCIGLQSEGSTGWPATDWMEDIVLRTAGPDVYDQWVDHEIPFNDPQIVTALETFGEVLKTEGYVLGGAESIDDLAFGDAPGPMFEDPPGCWLHRQASFINSFFPEDAEAGTDYDWFTLPPIDQEGILYAGELTVVGSNRPEVKEFLDAFISEEVQCEMGGVTASSRISPNVNVGPDCYANEILSEASEVLTEALEKGTGRFDASDLMPTEVGSGSFWTAMIDYANGAEAEPVLDEVEASWPS